MSKLSEALKALINAPYARPGTLSAPKNISAVYNSIAKDAQSKNVGLPAWLAISTAATMTLNSPESLSTLHSSATTNSPSPPIYPAELMREVGLKCISFNGIPRSINMLNAFHASLPRSISSTLSTTPTRNLTSTTTTPTLSRGKSLWNSIYTPFTDKLTSKLSQSHPDLPVHIIEAHYGTNLSNPPSQPQFSSPDTPAVGRVLTSLVAIACLRAQTGVGPQVLSHVFGLRKAFDDGTAESEGEVAGGRWLASDEGSRWVLEVVDQIVSAISQGQGTSFAPGFLKAKL